MKLHTIMDRLGDDVGMQRLDDCMTNIRTRAAKRGVPATAEVSFLTEELNPGNVATRTGPIGFIVWVPRDKLQALLDAENKGKTG